MCLSQIRADLRSTLRRDPGDPPPWKVGRRETERSVNDEDWGGTFDEMLMVPASVRGQETLSPVEP